jgi:hypothetical protein
MADQTEQLKASVLLNNRSQWPYWYAQFQYQARSKGVWDFVDPDSTKSYNIENHEPDYPSLRDPPESPVPQDDGTIDPEAMTQYNHRKEAYNIAIASQNEVVQKFKYDHSKWQRNVAKLLNLRTWVTTTVSADLMGPVSVKMVHQGKFTLQDLIRTLKADYAPTESNTAHLVRQEYRQHLEKAKQGRISPEKWFNDWQLLYSKAQAFQITEIEGELALTDFLDALAPRIATEWAPSMRRKITMDAVLGNNSLSLDQLAKIFSTMLQERAIYSEKGKADSVFATFSGKRSPSTYPKIGLSHSCPCKPGSEDGCGSHRWEAINCRRLQTALTGSAGGNTPKIVITDVDRSKIIERLGQPKWSELNSLIKDKGWKIKESSPTKSKGNKSKYPGSIVAAVINPTLLAKINAVYSVQDGKHPLSSSTIYDNGAAVHVVNDRNLLVPGSFKRSPSEISIVAGTQYLPISGTGKRVIKKALDGRHGQQTEDLTLTDVNVIDGFHVNIVAAALLKQAGVWHLGLDDTLRYGGLEDRLIVMRLHPEFNLLFIEFKKSLSYQPCNKLVNATRQSTVPQVRSGNENVWHQRAGHLGKVAIEALALAAQNVRIEGTRRIECDHCSTAHATQVISRRPRERSPRPFYRISWDLFDMPIGRLHEKWSMIIKEDFSGKLFNNNLQNKNLNEIMKTITDFRVWVKNKYGLTIVEIHQDNDTATTPWRGQSRFEEWATEEGITIRRPPPYTHEPNGSAERAGQELITKSIKMRTSANLPTKLWPIIMDAAAYLFNMSPTAIHAYRSPNEVLDSWFQQYFRYYQPATIRNRTADLRPDWSGIYAYGCKAYPLDRERSANRDKRGFKVTPRAHIGYLIGYKASNIYIVWVPKLDEVITTRNVTFNEEQFYSGDPEDEMPMEDAIKFVDILHDNELVDQVQDIEYTAPNILTAANDLNATTEGNLRGEPIDNELIEVGQPNEQEVEEAEATRDNHTASENLRIRVGRKEIVGLATPDDTPEPEMGDQCYRRGTDSQQVVQQPGRAGSEEPSDRSGSHGVRQERPPNPANRTALGDSTSADEAGSIAPTPRRSRRQQGAPPEIDRYMGRYPPQRRPGAGRPKKDRDQMGGEANKRGVHALIADIGNPLDQWEDVKTTYLPGIDESWDDRASYKTMNSIVMAAMLNNNTRPPILSTKKVATHWDQLPHLPTYWKQLDSHPYGQLFKQAATIEINQLLKHKTWTEITRASVQDRPLPLKWVFTYKCDQDGYFVKCKARIVVRGDLQDTNTLDSTYAATLAAKSFRTAMAIAAEFDLEIRQYDVVGAFLNALITADNPVVCELPDGFRKEGKCVRLNRALYGLRDSPLLWYEEFSGSLKSLGLTSAKEEPCLFYDQERKILVLFYVDDILLMYHKDHDKKARDMWNQITSKYEIKDQGPVEWFLGVRVIRNRQDRTITLVHDAYIDKITKKFNLMDGSFPQTPLPSEELIKNAGEASKQHIKSYQERVGSVLYTAIMMRPDIAYAVSKLSHFLTNPSDQHSKAVDRVIMYLYRTRFESIQYGNYNGPDLTICGDASFADDPETRKSSHGYIAMLFGGAIFWKAARQSTVTTSTTEAELLALDHVTKEAMALKRFFKELTLDLGELWHVWCDNQQTIRLVVGKNERINTRLRHVDIQNMWLRQEHAKGSFKVEYLETSLMPADGLTKSLTQQQFQKFKELLNLKDQRSNIKV